MGQCNVNTIASGQTTASSLIGQSITMPNAPCFDGGFTALRVVQTSNNSDITVEIYDEQNQLQYRQENVALTLIDGASNRYRIPLGRGEGSLAYEGGKRYTFYFSSAGPLQFSRTPSGISTYGGGNLYENGPVVADLYLEVETTQAIPAPVAWAGFEATAEQGGVNLEWSTEQEWNNAGFTVERSAEGYRWQDLATVAAGTQPEGPQHYAYRDHHPLPGENFYRIRQTDYDGTTDYSDIRTVRVDAAPIHRLYPNPARAGTTLHLSGSAQRVELISAEGRILPLATTNGQVQLPAHLPPALYVVRIDGKTLLRLQLE